ncbi:hypothetical protein Val02_49360 [Virgisporangium aliadipatigenens]|uniref:Uncharacterized protein n=1 Tax=Virgisporangium aliadipatigenens TaxID=741659 RepID=A0A8J3YQD2_9ACTN|nr:hypothetical protein [Virgisporangium aliadipatigenens]GIJ48050.1 hypothetical protein Val02_49360 [Virgisporangium aliadipatigenens]
MSWIRAADGETWINLDRATRAWVAPCQKTPGHFIVAAEVDGACYQLGRDSHDSKALAEMVLKNYLS